MQGDHDRAFTVLHGGLQALVQPVFHIRDHLKAIDHHFDVVDLVTVHLHLRHDVLYLTVYPDLVESPFADVFEQLPVMALTTLHYRSKQVDLFAPVLIENKVYDLLVAVTNHFLSRHIRIGISRPREK